MAHSNQIFNELQIISKVVANLPDEDPYQVPLQYFDNLADQVMNRIATIENGHTQAVLTGSKFISPFTTPTGYFEHLPAVILNRIKTEEIFPQEEQEVLSPLLLQLKKLNPFQIPGGYLEVLPSIVVNRIVFEETSSGKEPALSSLLLGLKRINPFKIPEDYFEALPSVLFKRIEWESSPFLEDDADTLSPLLGQLRNNAPFKVPEGYFDEFSSDIISGVNAIDYVNQELESFPPVINDLKIHNVYKVPDGYFVNLVDDLLNVVKRGKKAPVISIGFNKKMIRYAAAALVAGVLSVAAWMFYQNKPGVNPGNELADIQKISSDEMIHYLDTNPVTPGENAGTALFTMKDEDVKEILADVPDEELQRYLEQHAVSKDLIIN